MPSLLKNIRLKEVSLCRKGANQHSAVVLRKSDNPFSEVFAKYDGAVALSNPSAMIGAFSFLEENERQQAREFVSKFSQRIYRMLDALNMSADSIIRDTMVLDKESALKASIAEFQTAVAALDGSDVAKKFAVHLAAALVEASDRIEGDGKMTQDVQKQLADEQAKSKSLADKLEAAERELAKARLTSDEKSHCDALPEAEQAAFLKMSIEERAKLIEKAKKVPDPIQKQLDEQAARIKKQDDELAKLRDDREMAEFTEIAKAANLPVDIAKHLRDIKKASGDAFEAVMKEVRALQEQVKTGKLFTVIGGSGGGNADSAFGKMEAKAAELRKADPALTKEQAFTKVYDDPANADLVRQYRQETAKPAVTA